MFHPCSRDLSLDSLEILPNYACPVTGDTPSLSVSRAYKITNLIYLMRKVAFVTFSDYCGSSKN